MPILNPDKPKSITLTMANTLFGALSKVRPVNWGMLIHKVVSRAIPYIGRKPSYLPPFIMHLYAHYGCTTIEEDDMMTIAEEEVAYNLQPVVPDTSTSSDHAIPEAPPSSPGSPPQSFRMPNSPHPPSPRHRPQPPEATGHRLMLPGGTWIYPRGSFWKTPSSGCTMTWWISRPNTTNWSTSSGSQRGSERLRTRKHPSGAGQEGGPERPGKEGARTG